VESINEQMFGIDDQMLTGTVDVSFVAILRLAKQALERNTPWLTLDVLIESRTAPVPLLATRQPVVAEHHLLDQLTGRLDGVRAKVRAAVARHPLEHDVLTGCYRLTEAGNRASARLEALSGPPHLARF
jgi:hypothetical protein